MNEKNNGINIREKILYVARDEFSLKGYLGSSISGISNRLSISKTEIYYYFTSKKEIFKGAVILTIDELNMDVISPFVEADEQDKRELLITSISKSENINRIYFLNRVLMEYLNKETDQSIKKVQDFLKYFEQITTTEIVYTEKNRFEKVESASKLMIYKFLVIVQFSKLMDDNSLICQFINSL